MGGSRLHNFERPFVLAVDAGTESVRASIFDVTGQLVIFHVSEYPVNFPRPGWAEQSPDDWWRAMVWAVRGAINKSGLKAEDIAALGLDTTCCSVVFMDSKRKRVLRPSLIWMDVRATEQAKRIAATGNQALKYNGWTGVSPEWMPCKVLWVKENEPDIYTQADTIFEYLDWMIYRLTGRITASINNTTVRWYYNRREGGWPEDFYEEIGLLDALDRFPGVILNMGEPVGELLPEVAEELGLKAGIPVAEGGADAYVATLGLNIVQPGRLALITGSSHMQLGLTREQSHHKGIFGAFPDATIPGYSVVEGGQISSGSILKWFRQNFLGAQEAEARAAGISVYRMLDEQAAQLPPGSEGIIVLDYWQGNRTPWVDPEARGVFWGLSLKHKPANLYRAIMEGVAYGTHHILSTWRTAGFEIGEVYACGGATQSPLWLQIHADVANVPIHLTRVQEAASLGSAVLAAVAAGIYPSTTEAADKMVTVVRTVYPDAQRHEEYQFFYEQYVQTYLQLKGLMHSVTRYVAKTKENAQE
ncbi:MAG: xylulose kinase [Firmicutes bacterium]|nr:xylulose kinase [Bacillota bacterium]